MHKTQPASLDRNYGIDLLRLVSMFLVTILHVLNQGGALDAASGVNQYVGACMMLFTMCSVNCFGIISGYVLYSEHEHPYRFSKYFSIWLQVFLYSFGLTLLSHLSGLSKVTPKALLASALPLTTDRYWYFTAYTGVFFLAPWLNKLVRGSSRLCSVYLLQSFHRQHHSGIPAYHERSRASGNIPSLQVNPFPGRNTKSHPALQIPVSPSFRTV